jgi:hypothetical protein
MSFLSRGLRTEMRAFAQESVLNFESRMIDWKHGTQSPL